MDSGIIKLGTTDLEPDAPVLQAMLALNTAHEVALSPLGPAELKRLVEQAFAAFRVGAVEALLIALDQDADYDSPNFLWFRDRLPRFVYVDRVVVSAGAQGRGLARTLYGALFDAALRAGHDRVVCEVNASPPNPASDAFHLALGFRPVGTALLPDRGKTVRYLERPLAATDLQVGGSGAALRP